MCARCIYGIILCHFYFNGIESVFLSAEGVPFLVPNMREEVRLVWEYIIYLFDRGLLFASRSLLRYAIYLVQDRETSARDARMGVVASRM